MIKYGELIKKILTIGFELFKGLFFYNAGKKSKENEVQKASLKNVSVAKKVETEVSAMSDDTVDSELSRFTRK